MGVPWNTASISELQHKQSKKTSAPPVVHMSIAFGKAIQVNINKEYMDIENRRYPLASIVCFTYQQERFVADAVNSLLNQDYPNTEIIISDDSSVDKTFDIINNVVNGYKGPHRVLVRKTARNIGLGRHVEEILKVAKGDYIFLAAGDDISLPRRVSLGCEFLEGNRSKYKGAFTNLMIIDKNSSEVRPYFAAEPRFAKGIDDFYNGEPVWAIGASLFFSRNLYDVYGGFSNGTQQEDGAIAFRALLQGGFGYLNKITVNYRFHDSNLSQGLSVKKKIAFKRKENILWQNWLKDALISRGDDLKLIKMLSRGVLFRIALSKVLGCKFISYPYFYARELVVRLIRHRL